MPKEKQAKMLCVDDLRHAEYYQMQQIFDELYAKSKSGEKFPDLMSTILSRENILLAYRNIKTNTGSKTAGTDKLTIKDIGRLTPDEVVEKVQFIINGSIHGYRPKPVRRKDIPKTNGSTRPLGIPCIWDRLIQQCIKQVMEPICEAKFSDNSCGFRPNQSVENAIQKTYYRLQRSKLHYVIEFDIKGFFDNVNHSKLIKQIWAMGICDKHLIYIIKRILKTSIKMPDGTFQYPDKGTPQGGIISPLLANIVLNELDHWIESQWQDNPVTRKHGVSKKKKNGCEILSNGYSAMRKTNLKEMYIVRYADDFRIFCRTKTQSQKTLIAVTQWLSERLKLEVSPEKTKIINVKRRYSEFLGFKIKVHSKGNKQVVKSHMCDKAIKNQTKKLCEQAKNIAKPRPNKNERDEVILFNQMVMGAQNYYRIATNVNLDCNKIFRRIMTIFTNRLRTQKGSRLTKKGRSLTKAEKNRYGTTATLRYVAGSQEPIYPFCYVQHKKPMAKRRSICSYTAEGRDGLHDNLRVNTTLLNKLMRMPTYNQSIEYTDNRISLFSAQLGKCAITGIPFKTTKDIHCHHLKPKKYGGTDAYNNLVLVLELVHILIHATKDETIKHYTQILNLTKEQIKKLNELREKIGLEMITIKK